MKAPPDKTRKVISSNRRALRDYFVIERLETGIALHGTEVKSIRGGQVNLAGGFARIDDRGQVVLHINIPIYEFASHFNHPADRPRRLLLHRKEINKLQGRLDQKGCTLIPLALYSKKGLIKVELGLCKGKQEKDKRETLRRKTADREAQRDMASHKGGR